LTEARTPAETLIFVSDLGAAKIKRKLSSLLILAFFSGVFISFAAAGSTMASQNLLANTDTFGIGRVLSGMIFASGLMMVVLTGAELFTGSTMLLISVYERKATVKQLLFNWLIVYIGNFIGGIFIAWLMHLSGVFATNNGLFGAMTIKIAVNKTSLLFHSAFIMGILCNWIVCTAIWVSFSSRDITGKIFAILFINALFVINGFEHSIANMYFIPAGIFAANSPQLAALSHISAEQLSALNWINFIVKNLIPVTLGNIIGGGLMVWTLFWLALKKKNM